MEVVLIRASFRTVKCSSLSHNNHFLHHTPIEAVTEYNIELYFRHTAELLVMLSFCDTEMITVLTCMIPIISGIMLSGQNLSWQYNTRSVQQNIQVCYALATNVASSLWSQTEMRRQALFLLTPTISFQFENFSLQITLLGALQRTSCSHKSYYAHFFT